MKEKQKEYFGPVIFGILLAFFSYRGALSQLQSILSDLNGHTYVYLPYYFRKESVLEAWSMAPYCMWHLLTLLGYKGLGIPLEHAAAYTNAIFALFTYGVFCFFIRRIYVHRMGKEPSALLMGALGFCLCVLQTAEAGWMRVEENAIAPLSVNPLHNPTYLAVRGFSVLCFCLVVDLWSTWKTDTCRGIFFPVEKGARKYYLLLSLCLFLSCMAKPTFAEMFIPAVGIMMLFRWAKEGIKKDGSGERYFAFLLRMFCCALPAVLYIFLQFFVYFIFGGSYGDGGSLVITPFLAVLKLFTENVGLSLLLSMAFPVFLLVTDGRNILKGDMGKLALVSFCVSFLEAAFLGESTKLTHGDFLWPMMSGMLLLFLVTLADQLQLQEEQADTWGRRIGILCGWGLFGIQSLSGILYMISMMQG